MTNTVRSLPEGRYADRILEKDKCEIVHALLYYDVARFRDSSPVFNITAVRRVMHLPVACRQAGAYAICKAPQGRRVPMTVGVNAARTRTPSIADAQLPLAVLVGQYLIPATTMHEAIHMVCCYVRA